MRFAFNPLYSELFKKLYKARKYLNEQREIKMDKLKKKKYSLIHKGSFFVFLGKKLNILDYFIVALMILGY